MPFIPGAGPIPAPPISVQPRSAPTSFAFNAAMDRLRAPEGQSGQYIAPIQRPLMILKPSGNEFPTIIPPAQSLNEPARTIRVGPASKGAFQEGDKFVRPLQEWLAEVNDNALHASELEQRLASGEDVDIHDVMIASEKSGIGIQLTMQVRNRMVEMYQEIMRMQV